MDTSLAESAVSSILNWSTLPISIPSPPQLLFPMKFEVSVASDKAQVAVCDMARDPSS